MNIKILLTVMVAFVIGGASAVALIPGAQKALFSTGKTRTTGKALIGGAFALIDHKGASVTNETYRGRYMLVYFGFTHCPDVCPAGLQVISTALDKIGPKAAKIQPLFISVDPERDTPKQMAAYVSSFYPGLVGLTGSPEQIAKVARAYRVYYAKVENKDLPGDYTVDHSSFFYLMDPEGAFVRHFPHSVSPEILADALKRLN